DPGIRNPMLYPTELRAQNENSGNLVTAFSILAAVGPLIVAQTLACQKAVPAGTAEKPG
ncbi:MAG: hypothetical protein RLZZ440_47, partial [Planctomycetota bacterium]